MDGRPQRKVADYLAVAFGARHLDNITTAGMVRHVVETTSHTPVVLSNLDVSITRHDSTKIAVVAHHDCAGNPAPDATQKHQVAAAVTRIEDLYPEAEVVGLWLGPHWIVERIRAA